MELSLRFRIYQDNADAPAIVAHLIKIIGPNSARGGGRGRKLYFLEANFKSPSSSIFIHAQTHTHIYV